MKIKVGFSNGPSPISKAIQYATDSNISHCFIILPIPDFNTEMVFQAAKFNVHYMHIDEFIKHSNIIDIIEVEVSDEQAREAELIRIKTAGLPYSYPELFGFLWVLINRKLNRKIKNPLFDGDHAYICVELVAAQLGINTEEPLTPADLYNLLLAKKA